MFEVAKEVKTLTKEEIKKMVKDEVEKNELSEDEAKKVEEVLCAVGGMSDGAKRALVDMALAGGAALLGAGAFYGITKALGYSYVRPDDVVEGYQLPSQDGTITTTKQKISFSRKVDDK